MRIFKFNPSAGRRFDQDALDAIQHAGSATPGAPKENFIKRAFKQIGLAQVGMAHIVVEDRTITIKGQAQSAAERDHMILAAGNIAGIEAVKSEIAVPAGTPDPVFHTVKPGETLETIAETIPHDVSAEDLHEANAPILHKEGEVYPGQTIRVPTEN
ncbi:LysM peptidoglycan-binding domain-containing protein [Tanticharoenia sakaeratensis]|jgi:nucleoid-associated protein YgaU|uniref:LysM domain-containing protein n=1 Tax=Tanticharoenia sakaeratensis NBRC 103193 TaxID=1231623 RepID=A0A0D6ML90_9PROT|nr:LysM peptidoglycan-binding domain-containing protein [Tanticharoenia sakaeratensis]GAN54225.1 LysM domain-containing protein [Tanticharoenia sakaeratensis NBRC 103193]GBQ19231.1 LysM domain-containing protein [Tanticharoenia sakaeratensis NBRC 103193]